MPPSSVDTLADMTAPPDYWVARIDHFETPLPNRTYGRHWGTPKKDKQRSRVAWALVLQIGLEPPPLPVVVTLTRISRGWPDLDGAIYALKYVRDAVAKYLRVDDGDEGKVRFEYAREKGKGPGVRVEIRRAP